MKNPIGHALRLGVFGCLCLSAPAGGTAPASPVVVELFESQGCSSCPPSEHVMEKLRQTFGANVILLTFHVDYWDYLGWKDVFSDPRATERQKDYGAAFQQDSIYTPEMVIQGEMGFVGSDMRQALSEVKARQAQPRPSFPILIQAQPSGIRQISIDLPPELRRQTRHVVAVVYENAAPVAVLRGENAGATMSGSQAVRTILKMPLSSSGHASLMVPINPAWDLTRTGVAVLVRGERTAILAASQTPFR